MVRTTIITNTITIMVKTNHNYYLSNVFFSRWIGQKKSIDGCLYRRNKYSVNMKMVDRVTITDYQLLVDHSQYSDNDLIGK